MSDFERSFKIPDHRILSKKEERQLFEKYEAEGRPQYIKDEIVTHNLKFLFTVASKYQIKYPEVPLGDILGYGFIGLEDSVDRYDISKGVKFISYAVWRIRASIVKHMTSDESYVNVSSSVQENAWKKMAMVSEGKITGEEADRMYEEARTVISATRGGISIDSPVSGEGDNESESSLLDFIQVEEYDDSVTPYDENDVHDIINEIKEICNETEYLILSHKFGIGDCPLLNNIEIGKLIGCTPERVRQLYIKLSRKLISIFNNRDCIDDIRDLFT